MVKQYKIDEVKSLEEKLQAKKNIVLTNYTGIKVKDLSELRNKLREVGTDYKVVKNNLFKIALKNTGYVEMDEYLKGPVAVAFTSEDLSSTAKVLKEFKKEQAVFSFFAGVMENVVYDASGVTRIADLPSKEVLLSQVLSLVNGPGSGIAMGMNQIMASLARGIKAVAEQNA
ncbi:MAG TPA: 50S ribosomal protein L10 [Spirochaetota bacterium]|nr:50S ribosomal protein L10 [Spirochaetota bacterium]HPJ36870.1 50S ribosomal protein L10 [Spirochaetota bacterium]HPQ51807.1 50S ribosomal protein L10 [Spirochaetota bacterium]